MDSNARFMEQVMPNEAGAGKWHDLAQYGRIAFVMTAATLTTLTVLQSADGGGTSKALNFTRVDHKASTDAQYTTTIQASGNTYAAPTSDDIVVVEFQASDLDIDNGYRYVNAVGSVGTGVVTAYRFAPKDEQRPSLA